MGKGEKVGYVRVSSFDQNPERQLENIDLDKIYTDKASGKDVNRPELQELIDYVRDGDTVVVHSMCLPQRKIETNRDVISRVLGAQISCSLARPNAL